MNKETYEALKRIIGYLREGDVDLDSQFNKELVMVETWIDEVAKEYNEEKGCPHQFTERGIAEICPTCHEVIDFQIEE